MNAQPVEVQQFKQVPKDTQNAVGSAIVLAFERLPSALNCCYDVMMGGAYDVKDANARLKAADQLIKFVTHVSEKLEQSEIKINPLTQSIVRSIRYLGEQEQKRVYDRLQTFMSLDVGKMSVEQLDLLQAEINKRRVVLSGEAAARVA